MERSPPAVRLDSTQSAARIPAARPDFVRRGRAAHGDRTVLEGGFDCHDRLFFIPIGAGEALSEVGRRTVIGLFLEKGLLNLDFAGKLLSWRHLGFSIESATCIYDQQAGVALSYFPPRSIHLLRRYGLYACPVCASTMSVIAVILDAAEIRKIVACLAKKGRAPPAQ